MAVTFYHHPAASTWIIAECNDRWYAVAGWSISALEGRPEGCEAAPSVTAKIMAWTRASVIDRIQTAAFA